MMKSLVIALDIGHARGTGAVGVGGAQEHSLCTQLATQLAPAIRKSGHIVHVFDYPDMTNSQDLSATVAAINSLPHCDCVISLHMDASDNASARGAHTIFTSAGGEVLAELLADKVAAFFPGRYSKCMERDDLYMLNATRPPAVLIENGFITNASDLAKFKAELPDYVALIAEAVDAYARMKGADA